GGFQCDFVQPKMGNHERSRSCLDSSEEKEVIHHSGEMIDFLAGTLDKLVHFLRGGGVSFEKLDLAFENGERSFELMRGIGGKTFLAFENFLKAIQKIIQ